MLNIERQSEIVRFELHVLGETKLVSILYKYTTNFQPLTYELIAGNQEVCAGFIFFFMHHTSAFVSSSGDVQN